MRPTVILLSTSPSCDRGSDVPAMGSARGTYARRPAHYDLFSCVPWAGEWQRHSRVPWSRGGKHGQIADMLVSSRERPGTGR